MPSRTITLASTLAVALAVGLAAYSSHTQASMASLAAIRAAHAGVRLSGRSAVVVGGTSGIGHGVAVTLARAQVAVTIVGRSEARAAEVLRELDAASGEAKPGHAFLKCDVTLMHNIRECVNTYAATHSSLDMLVLSQGIATIQGRTETKEGIDQKLALHYFGRMQFIREFLPLLRRAPSPKVLSVLSAGVHSPYAHFETDFELVEHYSIKNAADTAGFYNDLALDALSQDPENAKISFIHAAPGLVNTNWGTEMPLLLRGLIRMLQPVLGRSIYDCGEFMTEPVLRDDAPTGLVLIDPNARPAARTAAHTPAARDFVWQHTLAVLDRVLGGAAVPPSAVGAAGAAGAVAATATGSAGQPAASDAKTAAQ